MDKSFVQLSCIRSNEDESSTRVELQDLDESFVHFSCMHAVKRGRESVRDDKSRLTNVCNFHKLLPKFNMFKGDESYDRDAYTIVGIARSITVTALLTAFIVTLVCSPPL